MKAFVSGQLQEKTTVRRAYAALENLGVEVTHDWTLTDSLGDYSIESVEAGKRAELDINGVVESDLYILLSDNLRQGKGMYVELGAALALAKRFGTPQIHVVGPMNHESIFYHHPLVRRHESLERFLTELRPSVVGMNTSERQLSKL